MAAPQVGRFNGWLRRLLSLKEPMTPSLLEDYFPVFDMLSSKPELYRPREERLFSAAVLASGGAALNPVAWIMNKSAGMLTVIEWLSITSGQGQAISGLLTSIGLPADGAGGNAHASSTDARYSTGTPGIEPPNSTTCASTQTGAAVVGAMRWRTDLGPVAVPVKIILPPGFALQLTSDASGVAIFFSVTAMGYERAFEPSEGKDS